MINAVFLSTEFYKKEIDRVYSQEVLNRISENAHLFREVITIENLETYKEYLENVEIIFSTWGMPTLSEATIGQYLPKLKAVFYAAGSVRSFARPFLNRNIVVVSAAAANAVPVAEFTLGQIILANKGYYQNIGMTHDKKYNAAVAFSSTFTGNYGAKVGIIGIGMIGSKVIELLKPFNLEVMAYSRSLTDERAAALGVRNSTLEEIFSQCLTISNHIANLPATAGLLNKQYFSKMLPNATFINTGRGAQVVEQDLIEELKRVPTRTAVLDVTDPEPPQSDNELYRMDNVFLTSHIAGSMGKEVERMGLYIADEFTRYAEGKDLKYGVALKMLETMA